jgi:hypothetical protein
MLFIILVFSIAPCPAFADVSVNGYSRRDGTYVAPYERTSPNSTRSDNYSTQGNVNPYTGKEGRENPYESGGGNSLYRGNSGSNYDANRTYLGSPQIGGRGW